MKITNTDGMWELVGMELALLVIIGLLVYALLGKRKGTYSWEKQKGAKSAPVIIAIIALIVFSIYLGMYLYDCNVIKFW
ncbi:hypothetical protein [Enterococcus asini]|uniref:hypothetical protein n=1 Tax=Enterococcus asini TaxID=57732 RepID=UPI00266D66A4|nr:hypothetical protein [Enterococcus asini]